jgi:hypothetical protein
MPKPKLKKKKTIVSSIFKTGPAFSIYFFLAIVLFAAGQIEFFAFNPAIGLVVSIFAAVLGAVIYIKGGRFSLPEAANVSVFSKVNFNLLKDSAKIKKNRKEPSPNISWKLDAFKPVYSISAIGVVISFALAGLGQFYLRQTWNQSSLGKGGWLFLAAGILFVASLWPWFKEGLKTIPISLKTEKIALGLILFIALFLRVFRITSMPQGLFIDQGFVGYSALRIIHEGWRPFFIPDIFLMAYSYTVYQVAFWFKIFGESETSLKLFYIFLSMMSLPLIYWTFRQLAGVRAALLTLFILAVMRWHIIFSRNSFPTVQVPLYVFGTLAFLLHGMNTGKKWAFVIAAFFFSFGFYTYQGFKVTPLLLVFCGIYEACVDWKKIKINGKKIALFLIIALVITSPILHDMISNRSFGGRESQLSIFSTIRAEHSFKPFWDGLFQTSLMFNRFGDTNARHNFQNYRMLDDVSGTLFILGLIYGLFHIKRRKYFYAIMGFFTMSLLCILTIDVAHANRLFSFTPFLAFLIATPISAVWGRVLRFAGPKAEWIFLLILCPFLWIMISQNYDIYFNKQSQDIASWREYSARETAIGHRVQKYGDDYEYFISPEYYAHQTINFLAYGHLDHLHNMVLPEAVFTRPKNLTSGLYFAVNQQKLGVVDLLKAYYPKGIDESLIDPEGNVAVFFLRIPPEQLREIEGLKAVFDRPIGGKKEFQLTSFPDALPPGPYHATLSGNIYIDQTDDYQCTLLSNSRALMWIGKKFISPGVYHHLEKGYQPVRFQLTVLGKTAPTLVIKRQSRTGKPVFITPEAFNTLPPPRGLKGTYYRTTALANETPSLIEWDPIIAYTDGNDFAVPAPCSIHWNGSIRVEQSGVYQFFIQTRSSASLKIDGKLWFEPKKNIRHSGYLTVGWHTIDIDYVDPNVGFPYLVLNWVKPNGATEIVPNSAFGLVP